MHYLLQDVRNSLEMKNYYAALALSLSLIDMCGGIDNNGNSCEENYINWAENYLLKYFEQRLLDDDNFLITSSGVIQNTELFFNINEVRAEFNRCIMSALYQLRCKFLHLGKGVFSEESSNTYVSEFELYTEDFPNGDEHCEKIPYRLLNKNNSNHVIIGLSVVNLCEFICKAVENWLLAAEGNKKIKSQLNKMIKIYEPYDLIGHNGNTMKIIGKPPPK